MSKNKKKDIMTKEVIRHKCQHPLGKEGLDKAYSNLVRIKVDPEDLKHIT